MPTDAELTRWDKESQAILDAASSAENLRTARMLREFIPQVPTANRRRLAREAAERFEARAAGQLSRGS